VRDDALIQGFLGGAKSRELPLQFVQKLRKRSAGLETPPCRAIAEPKLSIGAAELPAPEYVVIERQRADLIQYSRLFLQAQKVFYICKPLDHVWQSFPEI
jgi:hypothetical protein